MDSVTHIAIGACLGEAFAGKKVGKRAMIWGILAQGIPDLDFILTPFMSTTDDLTVHRGFSHSLLFAIIVSVLMGILAANIHKPHDISTKKWIYFFGMAIGLHLFLDGFNNYGVGWLEPFNDRRFSFNTIYVADPFFSIGPGIATILLVIKRKTHPDRRIWWRIGFFASLAYLCFSIVNKLIVNEALASHLKKTGLPHEKYMTTPAPFQSLLWFVAAGNDSGFYTGYRSVFDNRPLELYFHPKNENLLLPYEQSEDLIKLKRFSQGFYTASMHNDTLFFNDLRFGQVIGWMASQEKFAFHYYLQYPDQNDMVVQRGRFEHLDSKSCISLLRRMFGGAAILP